MLVWPFGHLLVYRGGSLKIYLLDILVGFLCAIVLLGNKSRQVVTNDNLFRPLLYFLIIAILSLVVNLSKLEDQGQRLMALMYLVRLIIYSSLYFALKQISKTRIKTTLIASVTIFISLSLIQYIFLPDLTSLKYLGFDDHYYRLAGTMFDPNFTGLILSIISLVFLQYHQIMPALASLILLGLTFSRASYLTYLVGLFTTKNIVSIKNIFLFLLILLLAIIISPKPFGEGVNLLRTFSIFSRLSTAKLGLQMFVQNPVFGWGYNTLSAVRPNPISVDNSFIFILVTTGILGFIMFINLMIAVFTKLSGIGKSIILLVLIHSLFNNSLFYIWIYYLAWFTIGYFQNPPKEYS